MNSPPTIYFLGSNFDIQQGTASTNLTVELARGFHDHGYRCVLVPLNQQAAKNQRTEYNGVEVRFGDFRFFDRLKRLPMVSWFRAIAVIMRMTFQFAFTKQRPSVLFCMSMWWWAQTLISVIGRMFGCRVIVYVVEEPRSMARMKFNNGDTGRLKFSLKVFQATLQYQALKLANGVCAITSQLVDVVADVGVSPTKLCLLPNVRHASKSTQTATATVDRTSNTLSLVYSGRINYTRDEFGMLLQAAKIANANSLDFSVDIYGAGSAKDTNRIKAEIAELQLESIVSFHGFVERSVLEQAQSDAGAFLLLKADIDQNRFNFPTKLMDYLAYAKPVIMTDIETHRDFFTDRQNSYFVQPGDHEALAQLIQQIASEPEQAAEIGRAGGQLIDSHFNATLETGRLIEFFNLPTGQPSSASVT